MNYRKMFVVLMALLTLVLAACSTGTGSDTGSEAGSSSGEIKGYDDLVGALRDAGSSVESAEELEQPFFTVKGKVIRVDGADVQVFEYSDEAAMGAEASQISPDGTSVGTSMMMWVEPPHFWAKGRLIVLYVGSDAGVIENLSGVLGDPIGS